MTRHRELPKVALMNQTVHPFFPLIFPFFFIGLWLFISIVLGVASGWFRLMANYPDQPEAAMLQLRKVSGSMGWGVSMSGNLNLAACPSGLRVGVNRVVGPFNRDFFVPWRDLAVMRGFGLLGHRATLEFGVPVPIGRLRIPTYTADKLARAAAGKWPERGPFPEETTGHRARRFLLRWVLAAGPAAAFFIAAPRLMAPQCAAAPVPVLVAILFPAIFFGLVALVRFFRNAD